MNNILKNQGKKFLSITIMSAILCTAFFTGSGSGLKSGAISTSAANLSAGTVISSSLASIASKISRPIILPGKLEAESYIAQSGVQKESCSAGTLDVCGIDPGDYMDYKVDVYTSGSYWIDFLYAGTSPSGTFQLLSGNDVLATVTPTTTAGEQTWATQTVIVNLNAGIQTLRIASNGTGFKLDKMVFTLRTNTVDTNLSSDQNGAVLPYVQYEAEAGKYKGQLLSGTRELYTQSAEASGREAVKLTNQGDYVQWVTTKDSNAIDIRNCIPDSASGGGQNATLDLYVNGVYKKSISMTSKYTWLYGTTDDPNGLSNTPSTYAHHYFDDASTLLRLYNSGWLHCYAAETFK